MDFEDMSVLNKVKADSARRKARWALELVGCAFIVALAFWGYCQ